MNAGSTACARNDHALALAAGQRIGRAAREIARERDGIKKPGHAIVQRRAAGDVLDDQRLGD
jgi:hypothetical protein